MKRICFLLVWLLAAVTVSSQDLLNIPFLKNMPVIDGIPDSNQESMEWRDFSYIEKTNDQNRDFSVRYKTAYNYTHLYLLMETDGDSIVYRDRAYQNGDGFHMVIAKPNGNKPTDEFYVLRFSPANKAKNIQARKSVWYYNIDLTGRSLSASTRFACQSHNGKCYYELLLSWDDVYPYHPLFSASIGLNLCFVKAVGSNEKNYYFLKYDKRIQWEQNKREYILADFEKPESMDNSCTFARLGRKNIMAKDSVRITLASFSPSLNPRSYYIAVCSADNYTYTDLYQEAGQTKEGKGLEFALPVKNLLPGGYQVVWRCSDGSEGEIPFSIMPEINEDQERGWLQDARGSISDGDYYTLLFKLQQIMKDYADLKEYEMGGDIRERYLAYLHDKEEINRNSRFLSEKPGISRRAFLSKVDSTLQPYSVKIPAVFDPGKKYPLLVMLHGSGSDDTHILEGALTEGNFIEIAPFGRGTSNCFSADNAPEDVKEAMEDAIRNYPVDTSRIIIAGFSMGGYGACRIFYEYPKLFKGVVVFSGHPDLANRWVRGAHPDFTNPKYLKPFKNIPVFIYHSKNDLNCPYPLAEELVKKLQKAGAKVELVTTPEGGHGIMDNDHMTTYYHWLRNTIE